MQQLHKILPLKWTDGYREQDINGTLMYGNGTKILVF